MNDACHDAGRGGELELPNDLDRNGSHRHVEPHLNRHEWHNGRRRPSSTSLEQICPRLLRGGSLVTARVWRDRGIAIVDPGQDASQSVAGEFARLLGTAVKLGPTVAVTFESVQFVDASALGVILPAHQALQECGGRIVLAVVPHTLRRLLAFTGLDATLAVYDSLEEAIIIQLSRAHAASRPRMAEGGA